MKGTMIVVPAE